MNTCRNAALLPVLLAVGALALSSTACHRHRPSRQHGPDWVTVTGKGVIAGGGGPPVPAYQPPPPAPDFNLSGTVRADGYGAPRPGTPPAQGKLLARRAAETDARRNLLEVILGVQVSSETFVRDFVTESDTILAEVNGHLQGARVVSEGQEPDGLYKVTLEVDLASLNPIFAGHAPAAIAPAPRAVTPMPGSGGAQARLMAERAAKEDAWRQLMEYAKGVQLESGTYVRDFIAESDTIASRVRGYIRRAEVVGTRYPPDGTVEVDMRFDMNLVRYNIR